MLPSAVAVALCLHMDLKFFLHQVIILFPNPLPSYFSILFVSFIGFCKTLPGLLTARGVGVGLHHLVGPVPQSPL